MNVTEFINKLANITTSHENGVARANANEILDEFITAARNLQREPIPIYIVEKSGGDFDECYNYVDIVFLDESKAQEYVADFNREQLNIKVSRREFADILKLQDGILGDIKSW